MFVVLNGMCIQKSIYYKYFGDITNARNDSANALYKKGVHDDYGYLIRVFDANTLEFIFVLMKQATSPSGSSFYSFFFMSAPKEDLLSKRVIKQSVCDSFYGGALFVEGAVFLNLATVIQK